MSPLSNSELEVTENIGYGAAIYVLGAENFELLDSTVSAKGDINNSPLIKIGPYGYPQPTNVFGATIKGNFLHANTDIPAIDTSNAGTDAPAFRIEGNTLYNAKLEVTSKDIKTNNNLIKIK